MQVKDICDDLLGTWSREARRSGLVADDGEVRLNKVSTLTVLEDFLPTCIGERLDVRNVILLSSD